uniref:Immunoglobulin domain-containing protein n=1 Tax=Chelonoidis abingdonii TaxID=106734 RepID=A0A8C0GQ73_CHEAB
LEFGPLCLMMKCILEYAREVTQKPDVLLVNEGESVNISCSITTKGMLVGMYLKREVVNAMEVLYITKNGSKLTINFHYKDRIQPFFLQTEVRIMLHRLQKNDTGLYVCRQSILEDFEPNYVSSQGTILVVKGIVCFSIFFLSVRQMNSSLIKKHCQEGKKKQANSVYEDMSYTLRLNTMATGNPYN